MAWVIFLVVAIPLVGLIVWTVFNDSFVQIEPGQLGLLLVRGKATDKALGPGPHWVPAIRRRMVQAYPSLELSLRASAGAGDSGAPVTATAPSPLEAGIAAPVLLLGDRVSATVGYTVRFRLDVAELRSVHDRFGPDGIWAAAGDEATRRVRAALAEPDVGIDDLFGAARARLDERVGEQVRTALAGLGFVVTSFALGDVDLGRTGEVIQATARARHEQAREEAEVALRTTRAKVDAELAELLPGAALRYRELDAWYDVVGPGGPGGPGGPVPYLLPPRPSTAPPPRRPLPPPPPPPAAGEATSEPG